MNIFVLEDDPVIAASFLCDKHLSKMLLESCQLMCTAKNILDENTKFQGQYKSTHVNHPCSVWTRKSYYNFLWLLDHAKEISSQYKDTYGKNHKCNKILKQLDFWIKSDLGKSCFAEIQPTDHPQCMPNIYKHKNVVTAYRNYYIGDKAKFAKWKNRQKPFWWPKEII